MSKAAFTPNDAGSAAVLIDHYGDIPRSGRRVVAKGVGGNVVGLPEYQYTYGESKPSLRPVVTGTPSP